MSEDTGHIREGFVRQRRSLIATSLALLLYSSSGVRLDAIDILGNSFTIARPAYIPLALWVAWFYFLLRYYQYLQDLPDAGWREAVAARVNTRVRRMAERELLVRLAQPVWHQPIVDLPPMDLLYEGPDSVRLKASGAIAYKTEKGLGRQEFSDVSINFSRGQLILPRLLSHLGAAINTRYFTEFALPFLVALSPLLYVLIGR